MVSFGADLAMVARPSPWGSGISTGVGRGAEALAEASKPW